jgi:hypothetical protein
MFHTRQVDIQTLEAKRRLRTTIARQRRRLDARARGLRRETGQLCGWRPYARRFPLGTLAVGLASGWIVAGGLRLPRWTTWTGRLLMRRGSSAVWKALVKKLSGTLTSELQAFWAARQ